MRRNYYLCSEIAAKYKVQIGTVYGWIRSGKLTAEKHGREFWITEDDLRKFEKTLRFTT